MHTFLNNFQQGGIFSDRIASHKAEFQGEENFVDKKSPSLYALQIHDLNLNNSVRAT